MTKLFCRAGENLIGTKQNTEQDFWVDKVIMHGGYNTGSPLTNDIALMKLMWPVHINKYVSPACLPSRDIKPGEECYIAGNLFILGCMLVKCSYEDYLM